MASQANEKPRGLPNPYAAKNLPNPYALATVAESGPVRFTEEQKAEQQKKTPAFHNPHKIHRPQAKGANVTKRPLMKSTVPASASGAGAGAASAPEATRNVQQPGLDYWRSTVEDDAATLDYKRRYEYEQREKKKQEKKFVKQFGYWKGQAPYKAEMCSNLKAYRASGVYGYKRDSFSQFLRAQAPPSARKGSSERSRSEPSHASTSSSPKPPAFAASPPDNQSAEDAFTRRARLAQNSPSPPSPPQSEPTVAVPPPPPPPPPPPQASDEVPPPPPASASYNPTVSAPPIRYNPTISAPPTRYESATISAPPVRYENATISAPPVRYEVDKSQMDQVEPEERPAKRPKLSKVELMMQKMGYVKGQGLGKYNDGITTHLEVKARKGAKGQVANFNDADDDSRSNVKSQQVFDILGGLSTKPKEPGRFGVESRVVVAWGCVDDIDWTADANRNDGGVRQEIGQAFGGKFGKVERIHINVSGDGQPVYIKFDNDMSALNAVNRFHEGRAQFRERNIRALFYPEDKFEASIYDH